MSYYIWQLGATRREIQATFARGNHARDIALQYSGLVLGICVGACGMALLMAVAMIANELAF